MGTKHSRKYQRRRSSPSPGTRSCMQNFSVTKMNLLMPAICSVHSQNCKCVGVTLSTASPSCWTSPSYSCLHQPSSQYMCNHPHYCIVLYLCCILLMLHIVQYDKIQYSTVLYCTVLYSTVQYITVG